MNHRLLRHVVLPAREVLTRGQTFRFLAELERTQWYPEEQLRELQWAKIRRLLRLAYDRSPYYRKVFERARVLPEDIRSFDDLSSFPLLTKQKVRDHSDEIKCRNAP